MLEAAIHTLGELGPAAKAALPALASLLSEDPHGDDLHEAVSDALGKIQRPAGQDEPPSKPGPVEAAAQKAGEIQYDPTTMELKRGSATLDLKKRKDADGNNLWERRNGCKYFKALIDNSNVKHTRDFFHIVMNCNDLNREKVKELCRAIRSHEKTQKDDGEKKLDTKPDLYYSRQTKVLYVKLDKSAYAVPYQI